MNTQSPPTTLSEERLLPCPFCGKQPTSEFCSVGVPGMEDCGYWGIDCTCGMSQVHADDEEFAIEKWNNRHAAEQMARYQWQPIESAPKNQKVIAGYHNCLGKWRTITACYYVHGTLEAEDCSGAEFAKEGWYEESDSHETLLMTDCPPTHWMHLPPAPEKGGAA